MSVLWRFYANHLTVLYIEERIMLKVLGLDTISGGISAIGVAAVAGRRLLPPNSGPNRASRA
jgi:hypothetical protein